MLSPNRAGLNDWLFANSVYEVTNKMDVLSASKVYNGTTTATITGLTLE